MHTAINIRSTAKNWIVSVHRTNDAGKVAVAPLATLPRRAYTAIALHGLVTSAQKCFLADAVTIQSDMIGVELLASMGLIGDEILKAAQDKAARVAA